jgi:hypothetical protein
MYVHIVAWRCVKWCVHGGEGITGGEEGIGGGDGKELLIQEDHQIVVDILGSQASSSLGGIIASLLYIFIFSLITYFSM